MRALPTYIHYVTGRSFALSGLLSVPMSMGDIQYAGLVMMMLRAEYLLTFQVYVCYS
jgi:hypothetical protein